MKHSTKNYFFLLCLSVSLSVVISISPIVILVHGTFAMSEPWARPGGAFFDALEVSARKHMHHLIPFAWNGGNTHKDRLQGAHALAKVILSYPSDQEKIIVGHSHGGNVIILASHLLSDPLKKMWARNKTHKELINELVTFLNAQYDRLTTSINGKQRSLLSHDETIELKITLFKTYVDIHNRLVQKHVPSRNLKSEFLIDRVYCLATPIDPILYKPAMNVIHHLFNFYSRWDVFQTGFGFYRRLFPDQDRIINFRIKINDKKWYYSTNPMHWELHNPLIAHHLLDIPYEFQKRGIFGFEKYSEDYNGEIVFDELGPHYSIDPKPTEEREKEEKEKSSQKKSYVT